MGNHRAERGPRRTASAGRASRPSPGGARRAAASASRPASLPGNDESTASFSPLPDTAPTPGRRRAEVVENIPSPETALAPAASLADTVTAAQGRVEPGRRRASRAATARTRPESSARVWNKPSVPVIAGVAALALSVGGAIFAPQLASDDAPVATAGANNVTQASAAVTKALEERDAVVSRDSRRDAEDAEDEAALLAKAEAVASKRSKTLASINVRANQQAAKIEANQWHMPVANYRISATFGLASYLWRSVHTGLDFAGPSGQDLFAVANGTITETGSAGSYGYRTILTLEDGTEIWYAHQSAIKVSTGDQVTGGQVIGALGSTGNSTGPHLHLEVRPGGGDPVDPRGALQAHGLTP